MTNELKTGDLAPADITDEAHNIMHEVLDLITNCNSAAQTLGLSMALGFLAAKYDCDVDVIKRNIERCKKRTLEEKPPGLFGTN